MKEEAKERKGKGSKRKKRFEERAQDCRSEKWIKIKVEEAGYDHVSYNSSVTASSSWCIILLNQIYPLHIMKMQPIWRTKKKAIFSSGN